MNRKIVTALITLYVLLGSVTSLAQSENPFIGAWDINSTESIFGSAVPPKNMSRSYTDLGNGSYAYQVVRVNQDDSLSLSSAIYTYDGTQYPIVSLDELSEPAFISYRRINDATVEYTVWVGGKVSQIGAKFVSPNYQQLTISIQFPNSDQENQLLKFNRRR